MSLFCRVHPKLMPYISAVASYEFGLQGMRAEIKGVESGSIITQDDKRWGDRFLVKILYCTKKLTWQILMYPDNLMVPPDFIMDDDFLAGADSAVIESQVPSLAHWEPSDPKCLLNVILELLHLYKYFQANLITSNSRLSLEYNALLCYSEIPLSDFELYIFGSSRVSLLAHLKIDYSKLTIPIPKRNYLTLLLLEFEENTRSVISLLTHGILNEIFGNIDLPELGSDMMLLNYIPSLRNLLQSRVDAIVWRLNQRKIFYSFLLQVFETALLNGDNITYRTLAFLLENHGIFYVVNIEIPLSFPDDAPEISVTSMRKFKNGVPVFIPLDKFRYDPEWDIEKIFKTVYEFIVKTAIPLYERHVCINEMRFRR